MMMVEIGDVVMPGDVVRAISDIKTDEDVILGPGVRRDGKSVIVTKSGVLKRRSRNIYYVDFYQKRYVPSKGENVVGIVTQKAGDIFKVDIGAHETASLPYVAFEGATKRNRPDVQVGDIVFAKLLVASKHMESELVCVDSLGRKGKLGVLDKNGLLFSCSISLARKILNPECKLLSKLAEKFKFEIAIGINGKVWIYSKSSVKDTIAVANFILESEFKPPDSLAVF